MFALALENHRVLAGRRFLFRKRGNPEIDSTSAGSHEVYCWGGARGGYLL